MVAFKGLRILIMVKLSLRWSSVLVLYIRRINSLHVWGLLPVMHPPPLQESNSPDLWPIQRGRSDQGSTEKGKISSTLRLKCWLQAETVYCITCQRDWALLEFLTDYFYIHRKDAGSLVPPHAQSLQFPRKMTKKVSGRAMPQGELDWPSPPSRCADMQGPRSSSQLRMNMSPHRPTGSNTPSVSLHSLI